MRNPAVAPPFVQMMQQMFHGLEVGAGAGGPTTRGGTLLARAPEQRASIQRSVSLLAPALGRTLASLHQYR